MSGSMDWRFNKGCCALVDPLQGSITFRIGSPWSSILDKDSSVSALLWPTIQEHSHTTPLGGTPGLGDLADVAEEYMINMNLIL